MKKTKLMVVALAAFALATQFLLGGTAEAKSGYLSSFSSTYPSAPSAIKTCVLCHPGGNTKSFNPYALDYKASSYNFGSIESKDSDGDGASNIVEINAGTFPGDASSKPAPTAPTLSGLAISGPTSVNENGSATFSATASWSDGSSSAVSATWSENSAYATISAGGVLTAAEVTADQSVTVSASYTSGGVTKSATKSVTIVNAAPTPAPTVSISTPAAGSTVKLNAVKLAYSVSAGTAKVYLDGTLTSYVSGNTIAGLANGAHTLKVQTTDASGNVGSAQVSFTVAAEPMTAAALPDMNGNGKAEVAVLLKDYTAGGYSAYLKDGSTGTLIKKISFGATYAPKGLVAVSDVSGNGKAELAMLGVDASGNVAVVLRDSGTGSVVKTVAFPSTYTPVALAVVPDVSGNSVAELAVLAVNGSGYVRVFVKDASTGLLVKTVTFPSTYTPVALAAMPDVSGNGAAELAVLAVNGSGYVRVIMKDAFTGLGVKTVAFPSTLTPVALTSLSDVNGNGKAELAVAGITAGGYVKTVVKDAATGLGIKTISFPATYLPQAMTVVSDLNGNSKPEIGVLGMGSAGAVRMTVKDAGTSLGVCSISFPARMM